MRNEFRPINKFISFCKFRSRWCDHYFTGFNEWKFFMSELLWSCYLYLFFLLFL